MLFGLLKQRSKLPILFHFTHLQAGSAWVESILRRVFEEHLVAHPSGEKDAAAGFSVLPVKEGHVYPGMMLTKEEFELRPEFSEARRFAVIRDLRDALVFLYLSRERAPGEDLESGLLNLIDRELPRLVEIQRSWLTSGEVIARHEDMAADDVAAFEALLIDRLELPVSRKQVRTAVEASRAERPEQSSNGEWRKHFTKAVAQAFLAKAGDLLVATGCERDSTWSEALAVAQPPRLSYRTSVLLRNREVPAESRTLIHLTHAKAGSSWIYRILRELFPDRIAPRGRKVAEATGGDLSRHVFEPGLVYGAMFMRADEFDAHPELADALRFVVIRDLRDTLVSLYFSVKVSHPLDAEGKRLKERATLESLNTEEGLVHMMETQLVGAAELQRSWLKRGELFYRYEDLLPRDYTLLRELFIERFRLPVTEKALRTSLGKYSFEAQYGRKLGEEDASSHGRQGAPGNWRKHFSRRVAETFAERFGQVLIDTGYEHDMGWVKLTQ